MKGKVLDFSIQGNTGIILGDNGLRYPFTGQQWKEQINPIRGTAVDFEVSADQQAIAIYIDAPTLGCDDTDVTWDSDKNEVGVGLKGECMNVLEEAQNAPSNTAQNTSAGTAQTSPIRISLEPDVGQPDYYTNVNIQSTVDQLNFYGLSVNRGNCQVMSDFKPNTYKILHFGSVLKLGARCRRDKIIELTVTTDQGNWTFNP